MGHPVLSWCRATGTRLAAGNADGHLRHRPASLVLRRTFLGPRLADTEDPSDEKPVNRRGNRSDTSGEPKTGYGGASGTVAKSISAYDKEVSDDLYGFGGHRYVSKERLEAMVDSEWTQLVHQLNKSRRSEARFFSFVDTISARNYAGTNEPHG
jgi:hypothetical protein